MEPLAVDLSLIRAILTPDLTIDVGRVLMARVASVEAGGRGVLSLAGVLLDAELPEGVSAGQELKLVVRELNPQKVVLGIQNDESQTPNPVIAAMLIPMPLGGSLQVRERTASGSTQLPDGSHSLKLHYDAPTFGPVDMHFILDAHGSLRLALVVPNGESLESAQMSSPSLLESLTEATGRQVSVTVAARREPLEVFA